MNTTPEALKQLYEALGGDPANVSDISTNVEALKFIYTQLGGEEDVSEISTIPDIIEFISTQVNGAGENQYKLIKFDTSVSLSESITVPANSVVPLEVDFEAPSIPADYQQSTSRVTKSDVLGVQAISWGIARTDFSTQTLKGETVYLANLGTSQKQIKNFSFVTYLFYT